MKQPKTLPIKKTAPIGIGFGDLLGLLVAALILWALQHYSDKCRERDIAEYERLVAAGERPQYTVMGIPVKWTPYDE